MTSKNVNAAVLNAARARVYADMLADSAADRVRTSAVADRLRADADRKAADAADAAAYAQTCGNIAARKDATQADHDNAAAARAYARRTAELAAVAMDAADAADADALKWDADTLTAAVYAQPAAYLCRVRVYSALDARADKLTDAARNARRVADAQPDNAAAQKAAEDAEKDARNARKDADNDADSVYYAFTMGGTVDARRPYTAAAYAVAYRIIDALTDNDADAYKPAAVRVYHDLTDANAIQAAARYVAARTARNAVRREGTPTQWRIDAAARAADWTHDDLADMYAAAADVVSLAAARPAYIDAVRRDARVLRRAADLLAALPPHGYAAARLRVVDAAAARLTAYTVTGDARTDAARARFLAEAADAAAALPAADTPADRAAAVAALIHAAYASVNQHLTDARAIRTDEKPAPVSLDDLDAKAAAVPDKLTADADAARAAAVRAAVRRARGTFTDRQAAALALYAGGLDFRAVARKMHVSLATARYHINAARVKSAAALAAVDAPADLHDAAAALAGCMDTVEAAAILDAAAARVDKKAAAANRADAADAAAAVVLAADLDAARAAVDAARAALPPVMRALYAAIDGGQSIRAVARNAARHEKTVRESVTDAARRLAAAALAAAGQDAADAAAIVQNMSFSDVRRVLAAVK